MKKVILLMFVPLFGIAQSDYFIDIRNDEGDIMWENITTSELSMDFHFTLGTSERYANHQQRIRDRIIIFHEEAQKYHLNLRDDSAKARKERGEYLDMTLEEERIYGVYGLAGLANLSSVYDCEKEWAEYVNSFNISKHPIIITDTMAFTKNHAIFNIISKEDYTYYSTYGEFAFKDYNVKGDFNDDGYIDQLIFYSFVHHDKGTVFNTLWQSYGKDFPWREYQGFGLVTKYNKYGDFYLIKIGLEVPIEIINTNNAVADRINKETKLFVK
tara:strand:+ start:25 stop:837 length:813 start_codon:yes stop_codon:yes gene_type:complete